MATTTIFPQVRMSDSTLVRVTCRAILTMFTAGCLNSFSRAAFGGPPQCSFSYGKTEIFLFTVQVLLEAYEWANQSPAMKNMLDKIGVMWRTPFTEFFDTTELSEIKLRDAMDTEAKITKEGRIVAMRLDKARGEVATWRVRAGHTDNAGEEDTKGPSDPWVIAPSV